MAIPILRSGMPWGQLKLTSKASTPASSHRCTISTHASLLYSCTHQTITRLVPSAAIVLSPTSAGAAGAEESQHPLSHCTSSAAFNQMRMAREGGYLDLRVVS